MKKSGFVLVNIRNSIDPEFLSELEEPLGMECEHDVPIFVWTIIRFKDTELLPIEEVDDNGGANETIAINNQTRNSGEEDRDLEIQAGVNN
jgi:hypothetical protein